MATTLTFYPDAHPEDTSVDGYVDTGNKLLDWADLRTSPGGSTGDADLSQRAARIKAHADTDKWSSITRSIFLFDTSRSPSGTPIVSGTPVVSATLTIKGFERVNGFSYDDFWINVFASNPNSDTALQNSDFATLSSTPLCDTPIKITDWLNDSTDPGAANDFVLNAAGLAAINLGGITKLGLRESFYDAAGNTPAWEAGSKHCIFSFWAADKGGDFRPKLVVEYGSVYPSDPSTRITGLRHRYTSADVKHPFTLEVELGGATQQSLTVLSKEPPTLPEMTTMPVGLADYIKSLFGAEEQTESLIEALSTPEITPPGFQGPFLDEQGRPYWISPGGKRIPERADPGIPRPHLDVGENTNLMPPL